VSGDEACIGGFTGRQVGVDGGECFCAAFGFSQLAQRVAERGVSSTSSGSGVCTAEPSDDEDDDAALVATVTATLGVDALAASASARRG
jgi:hypothetical protein